MTLSEVFLCLDSSAAAHCRGSSVSTKTLKAKQTDQCDNKRGMPAGRVGFVLVWCDRGHSSSLQSQLLCSLHAAFEQFVWGSGVKTLTFPHSNNFPPWHRTNIASASLSTRCENVRRALFISGKSYLIYSPPSSSAEAPVCIGPCFIWISKPVEAEEVARHFKCHFFGCLSRNVTA